jgi:hypothetical protein
LKETLKPMVYGQINPQSRKIIEGWIKKAKLQSHEINYILFTVKILN